MVVNKKEEQELQKQQAATYQQTPYQESDLVKQAQTMIQNQLAQKPAQYQSPWQTQLNDVIGKVMNREKFSYDLNADALYKQYADKFITQGKMAMMDTMGQAQAMTGGYGNSYAQNVGQQAYQGQLQQLNDKIPELYQLALSKYQTEGGQLMDQVSILGAMEDQAYGRYLDDRNFGYQQYRDQVADEQWQKEYAESIRRFDFENKLGEFAPKETPKPAGNPNPAPKPGPGGPVVDDTGFTGGTYSEAVAYLKSKGVDSAAAAGIMTASEWSRGKNSGSSNNAAKKFTSYKEYLQYTVDSKLATK